MENDANLHNQRSLESALSWHEYPVICEQSKVLNEGVALFCGSVIYVNNCTFLSMLEQGF